MNVIHLETALTELTFPCSLLGSSHASIPVPASHSYMLRKPRVGLLFLGPRYSWCQAPLGAQGNLRIPSTNRRTSDHLPESRMACAPPLPPPMPTPSHPVVWRRDTLDNQTRKLVSCEIQCAASVARIDLADTITSGDENV